MPDPTQTSSTGRTPSSPTDERIDAKLLQVAREPQFFTAGSVSSSNGTDGAIGQDTPKFSNPLTVPSSGTKDVAIGLAADVSMVDFSYSFTRDTTRGSGRGQVRHNTSTAALTGGVQYKAADSQLKFALFISGSDIFFRMTNADAVNDVIIVLYTLIFPKVS